MQEGRRKIQQEREAKKNAAYMAKTRMELEKNAHAERAQEHSFAVQDEKELGSRL